jgi:hypothetical protein
LKFKKGETFHYVHSIKNNITAQMMGASLDVSQNLTLYYDETDLLADAEGNRKIEVKGTRIIMDMSLGPIHMSADTARGNSSNKELGKVLTEMVGLTFLVTVDGDGNLVKIEGADQIELLFAEKEPGSMKQKFGDMLGKRFVEGMTNQPYFPLPDSPVQVGDTWTKSKVLPEMGFGKLEYEETLTLVAIEKGVAKIRSDPKLDGGMFGEGGIDIPGIGNVKVSDLKIEGEYEFGISTGRMVGQKVKIDLTMVGGNPAVGSAPIHIISVQETRLEK